MPLNIRSEEANQLAAELAILTGETKTTAVIQALKGAAASPAAPTAGAGRAAGQPA